MRAEIFRSIAAELFKPPIPSFQLSGFLIKNKTKHAEYFNYDFVNDRDPTVLKYCIMLLLDEMVTMINNMDYPEYKELELHEDKINKRDNIIHFLMKEKIATNSLFVKILGVFTNSGIELDDIETLLKGKRYQCLTYRLP